MMNNAQILRDNLTSSFDEFNNTTSDYPSKTLPELFTQQVAKTPDNVALLCGEVALTYAQLNQKTNQLANYLKAHIEKANPYVAIYMDRTPELIIGILSILKAGGAYVPLDIHIPKERMHYIFENSQTTLVLTDSSSQHSLPGTSVPILCIDKIINEINPNDDQPCDDSQLDELAYIIFTSGSTGQPKGVMTEHQAICNTLLHFKHAMRVQPEDCLLSVTTVTFDPSILDIFLPLISGAKLILAPYSFNREPALIERCLEEDNVTMMQATPATWKALINHGWMGNSNLLLMSMGEPLAPDLAQQLLARSKGIWNLYGPTELAIFSTAELITAQTDLQFVSIGKPIANVRLYILDEFLHQVPIGTPGELYIGGKGVGRGYLNPELTKERYVPDPFSRAPNTLLYKTGDLCTWLPDGRVKIFGRLDFQVKIRGFRIELGEIEMVLKRLAQVKDVVVLASGEDSDNKKLIAYYLTNQDDKPLDDLFLKEHLENYLPDYMMPSAFVHLKEFPLNANGKIDRGALPNISFRRERPYQAPRNQLEQELKALCEEVLLTHDLSVDDSIFSVGGNSLFMMSILTKVAQSFEVNVAFYEFYQNPTIAQLAALIDQKQRHPERIESPNLDTSSISILSESQLNLWMLNKVYPNSTSLNIVETIRIDGELKSEAFDLALDGITQKYPILSGQFSSALPIQKSHGGNKPYFERISLQHLSLQEQDQTLQGSLAELKAYRTMKKGNALLKIRLFDLSDKQSEIQICVSHMVADQMAFDLLISELSYFYTHETFGFPRVVPSTSYRDCMAVRDQRLQKTLTRDLKFWKHFLNNVSPFTLPTKDLIPPGQCKSLDCQSVIELDEKKLQDLQMKSNRCQVSLVDVLNAIIATALVNYANCQGSHFVMTLVKSGRENDAENHIMGNFAKGNLIKIDVANQPSIMTLAQRIHQSVIDSEQYQDTYGCVKYPLPAAKSVVTALLGSLLRGCTKVMMAIIALFYKKKMNHEFFYRYCDSIASMASKKPHKNSQQQPVQVTVNVFNNFLQANNQDSLFGFPMIKAEEFQGLGITAPNNLSFVFFREPMSNKRYLRLHGNMTQASREQLLQSMAL
jgi:amino acid adenylation domain-containing protein